MLPDLQNEPDGRGVDLDQVGISGLRYPVTFDDGDLKQAGIADIEITIELTASLRGTHMSRMVELAEEQLTDFDPRVMPSILKASAARLDARCAMLKVEMCVATQAVSPASGMTSWQVHDLVVVGHLRDDQAAVHVTVVTDVTSLCPCSKAISDYGAHNQRCRVALTTIGDSDWPYPISVQESIDLIRACGSHPVLPLVKRSDERVITMSAYDKPMFVEDIARDLSMVLRQRHVHHRIDVRSIESIHSHDAISRASWLAGDLIKNPAGMPAARVGRS